MKNYFTILISLFLISFNLSGQNGYILEYLAGGPLYHIDLSNAEKTLIGNTMNNFGAGDIGPDGMLYAINSVTNDLYQIDISDGTFSLIASILPPPNHIWSGMAYDETNDIMYGYSANATSTGEGSLHIIDITDGSYTLVGTQTEATAIGCIAITDDGHMYGMHEVGGATIYEIDTGDGSLTLVGPIGQLASGMGHGMDYCSANQTMYLTTYNSETWENTLRIINLNNGSSSQVGDLLGGWIGVLAIPSTNTVSAHFSADQTEICLEEEVQFTDESFAATSWLWTFEGGVPATSTEQNPLVTYHTAGIFDVTLEVSDGIDTDTDYVEGMISVSPIPNPEVSGDIDVCINNELIYSSADHSGSTYNWSIEGGTIVNGNGTNEVSVLWTSTGEGSVQLTETSAESCEGISEALLVTVDACVGILETPIKGLKVYPNPAQNHLVISFGSAENTYELSIYNQFGYRVFVDYAITADEQTLYPLDISSFASGLYFVQITDSSNQVYKTKFEILR